MESPTSAMDGVAAAGRPMAKNGEKRKLVPGPLPGDALAHAETGDAVASPASTPSPV